MPEDFSAPNPKKPLHDLILVAALAAYAVIAILSFWQRPYLLSLLLLPAPAALLLRLGRGYTALAAAGSVIGPLTEAACVWGGLWSYAERGGLPLIPPWLLVIWACFPSALWLIVRAVLGEIPESRARAFPLYLAGIALEVLVFIAFQQNILLLLSLALLLGAGALAARPEKSTAVLMAAGSILGPACEALPVAAGAWHYARADLWGMPLWLPLAYALFAAMVAEAGLALIPPPIRAGGEVTEEISDDAF